MQRKLVAHLFVFSFFLGACVPQESVLISASPGAIQTMIPTTFASQTVSESTQISPITTQTALTSVRMNQFPLRQTVDEITVEITGYQHEDNLLIIDFCFSSPTDENWLFDELVFTLDNHRILPKEQRYNSGSADGISCGSLSFSIDHNIKAGNVELMIGQLQNDVIPPDCAKAQANLDDFEPNIVVKVHCFSSEDGGGYRIETLKNPENMSQEAIADLVRDAFSEVIQINMSFSFRVEFP